MGRLPIWLFVRALLGKPILADLAKVGAAPGTNEVHYDESNADDPYELHDADPAAHA